MAITDLTNTTWVFNVIISVQTFLLSLNFTSNDNNYTGMVIQTGTGGKLDYDSTRVYTSGTWIDEAYKTINITGGTDATNTSFITWLESNATQQIVSTTYYATSDEFTAVADAIRTKGGTSAPLEWTSGYISAINALGGGAPDFTACDIEITDNAGMLSALDAVVACHYDSATNKVVAEKWNDDDTDCYPDVDGDVYTWWDVVVPYHGVSTGAGAKVPWVLINNTALLSSCTVTSVTNGYAALCSLGLLVAPNADGVTVRIVIGAATTDTVDWTKIVDKTISGSISNSNITTIGAYAFYTCRSLQSITCDNVTTINNNAFYYCSSLFSVNFPKLTSISNSAFYYCSHLTNTNFPQVKSIGTYVFRSCNSLATISLPNATIISAYAFDHCIRLVSLYLMGSSVCSLGASTAFTSTPIGGYSTTAGKFGSIYVPSSLYNTYLTATNWTYFSSRLVSM